MTGTYLKIKNWDEFQHYKDRDPKWIKVYRDITDNYEFSQLPDSAKGHLLGLWLLAAKLDNKIPADPKWIGARINATAKIDLGLLERSGFIAPYNSVQNDTEIYSESNTLASLEGEAEKRRGETEKKRKRNLSEAEKKRNRIKANSDIMIRIGDWFGRKPDTLWNMYEAEALESLGELSEDELETMRYYYEAEIKEDSDYRRRTIATMLNNWNSELDKAIEYKRKNKPSYESGSRYHSL